MYKKLFAFCGLFAILSQNLNANWEYVIDIPKVLSPDIQEEAYKIVSRYRFPSILNPSIQEELPQPDLDDIVADEPRYISRRLKAINDAIEAYPIPKTLYQLLCFKAVLDNGLNGNDSCYYQDVSLNSLIFPSETSSQKSLPEACLLYTEAGETELLYWKINKNILDDIIKLRKDGKLSINIRDLTCVTLSDIRKTVQKPEFQPKLSIKRSFVNLFEDLKKEVSFCEKMSCCSDFILEIVEGGGIDLDDPLQRFINYHDWLNRAILSGGNALIRLFTSQNASIMELIEECVMNEAEDPRYVLYRGAPSRFDSELATKFHISFSDGLFGGVINDLNSGNALEWSLKRRLGPFIMNGSKLWKISLDRRRLLNGEFPVFIPPAISLLATFGSGEFHHPKTKILQLMPDKGYNGFDDSSNGMENSNGASIAVSPTLIPEYFSENKITIEEFSKMLEEIPNGDIFEEQISKW